MNCLKKKRLKRKIHDVILKILIFLHVSSLFYWILWIDAIISWQPYAIMSENLLFLGLCAYANGYVTDTKPYYERKEKEDDHRCYFTK